MWSLAARVVLLTMPGLVVGPCSTIGTSSYEACRGKTCGAPCRECDPDEPECVESTVVKQCSSSYTCLVAPVSCEGPGPLMTKP